jgi:hypothetical protein
VNRQALRVAVYRFGATFRRRRGGFLAIVLLVGLIGGLAMGAVAGARRTQASFSTYFASTNPSTMVVFVAFDNPALGFTNGYAPATVAKFAELPYVHHEAAVVGFDGNLDDNAIKGVHFHIGAGEKPPVIEGSFQGEYTTQDRVTLVAGRLADPERAGEAVMNAQAAAEAGVHVGSVITLGFNSDAQEQGTNPNPPAAVVARVRLVGLVVFSQNVVEDQIDALGSAEVLLSPALTRKLAACCAYYSYSAIQVAGGSEHVGQVESEVSRLQPKGAATALGGAELTSFTVAKADRTLKPEAIALGAFGGLVMLAALLIAGQVIGRQLRLDAGERETMRALGSDPATTMADGLIGTGSAVVLGSVLAVVVAVALSPLAPLGPVRPVYPDIGVAFDWPVLGLGFALLVVVLGGLSVVLASIQAPHQVAARRRLLRDRRSSLARAAAASGLPTTAVTGIRFALEPGAGSEAVPVRSAILGAVLAVIVVVATVTFGASLNSLVTHPSLYGWNWNYALVSGFAGDEDLPAQQTATLLAHDPDVVAASGVYLGNALQLDKETGVPVLGANPNAPVAPPLLSGHGLEGPKQIVLASSTLASLHKKVGDTVVASGGAGPPVRLRIVGTVTMPAVGGLEMGIGAIVDYNLIPAAARNSQDSTIAGPSAFLIRTRSGESPAALRGLTTIDRTLNRTNADQPAGGVVSVLRPAEIVNSRAIEVIPTILGAGLAAGAMVALALILVASVRRRRRDLAVLKTLGLSGRQLGTVVAWQSSVAVAIGAVVGVPLGIILGRLLWDLFANLIAAVPAPSVPGLTIAAIVLGALVLANAVAAFPGRIAARTPTGILLRVE